MNPSDYHESVKDLDQFGKIIVGLIKELLIDSGVQFQSIAYRVKDYESVLKKIDSSPEKYADIKEMTDLLGVRVITYFPDDVDKVADIVAREFKVDNRNSVDKRKLLQPDTFGYLSLHYVAELALRRSKLVEYKRFSTKKFELQIRSVLQHAWAEIEHDLGYKSPGALPNEVRRRFSRLAGLLELADDEFERLRKDISAYETRVNEVIKKSPQDLRIDQSTIVAALESEKPLIDLDRSIAKAAKVSLAAKVNPTYAGTWGTELKKLGVQNIEELTKLATKYREHIELFVRYWRERENATPTKDSFARGIGLFYLGYILAAKKDESELKNWGLLIRGRHEKLLKEIRSTWEKVIGELGEPQ